MSFRQISNRQRVPFPIFDEPNTPLPPLPANHFLSQQQQQPQVVEPLPIASSSSTIRNWENSARPDTSSLAAADYDVSVQTGFLPPEEPIRRLGKEVGGGWEDLEDCLQSARDEVKGLEDGGVGRISERWRVQFRKLIQPELNVLTTLPLLRRAHVLLSFLGHFYIHSTFPTLSTVPSNIAIPWKAVSGRLGIPPILTYADTVLWNWYLVDPTKGIVASNIDITTTFTSTPSERAFFLLSLLCELHAPHLLRLMSATLDEAFFSDSLALPRISSYLLQISTIVDQLTQIMIDAVKGGFGPQGQDKIIPECFYWDIRPWFNGGKWIYEGAGMHGEDEEMEWGGPSAGQSSLVHALDVFLSVDHSPRSTEEPTPTTHSTESESESESTMNSNPVLFTIPASQISLSNPNPNLPSSSKPRVTFAPTPTSLRTKSPPQPLAPKNSDSTFMSRASEYMPSFHRSFLQHLSHLHLPSRYNLHPISSVRTLALHHPQEEISESYDAAVRSMKRFRDGHMRLVTVFIITVSKREPRRESIFWEEWNRKKEEARETRRKAVQEGEEKLVGTGGTELVGFLKLCRERTVEALIGDL